MKYFSVPADFNKETIDKYEKLNNKYDDSRVIESYGNITIENRLESGRSVSQLPKVKLHDLQDYISYSNKRNIDFNYTLNAPFMQNREFTREGILEIKNFLTQLYNAGVRYLTVTLPSVIQLIKSMDLDFNIKASTICSITNANKAMVYKRTGVERIVVEQSINRDFHTLKRIRNVFGPDVEVIVNTPCHLDCAFRMLHYNQNAGDSLCKTNETSFNYYEHQCMLRRYEQPGNWLKLGWIRPEDIKYYTSIGIKYFKLQGRQTFIKGGNPVRVVEHYFKEDYQGDLIQLINLFATMNSFKVFVDNKKLEGFIKPFFEKENFCTRDCTGCNYCEVFSRKCIDFNNAQEVSRLATKFYHQYDEYSKLLEDIQPQKTSRLEKTIKEDGDFTF